MKKHIIAIITILASSTFAFAQDGYDLYQYSYGNRDFTTARVAAMGGAFTSLGADASSVHINPAGLGLYTSSDISFSPSIRSTAVLNSTGIDTRTNSTKFNLNNLNAIFSVMQDDYSVVRAVTLGIGYNVSAINTVSSNSRAKQSVYSIADYYSTSLNNSELSPSEITISDKLNPFNTVSSNLWGAVDAWNNGLISHDSEGFHPDKKVIGIDDQYETGHSQIYKGTKSNLNFSLGMKLGEYISVGMTLGMDIYNLTTYNDYYEIAAKNNTGTYDTMLQYEEIEKNGSGAFDFKIGVIAEPIAGLRIGAAYHAPRSTKVREFYLIDQEVSYLNGDSYYTESEIAERVYKMSSPSKLLTGISYVVKGIGIISVDYQRVWYGSMKLKDIGGSGIVNQDIKSDFQATNSIYVGAEVYVGANIFVRGGYNYTSSPLTDYKNMNGYDESSWSATGGFGYRAGNFYVDFAYIFSTVKQYYASSVAPTAGNKVNSSIYTITLGVKF